jgi:hypothetical protein
MTESTDLQILMGAIEYGRNIGADVGHSSRIFILYYALGMITGAGLVFVVTL